GTETPVVYTGVCITEGGPDVDAAITFDDLAGLLERRGVTVHDQASYFGRVPEERRRHWSTAGGLPLEVLMEETQASRRFRKVRGLGALEAIARAVAVDHIDLGFVDILPCEGCLDHPLLGPREELFRRREIVGATEPARARGPVVDAGVAGAVRLGAVFPIHRNGHEPAAEGGGAERPGGGSVRRAVRGPGQLQAGERPVRARGGERSAADGGPGVRVAHPHDRPRGALRRRRVRAGAGAHGGGRGARRGG